MPGESFAESLQIVLGEVGDLPYLPELPGRGVSSRDDRPHSRGDQRTRS